MKTPPRFNAGDTVCGLKVTNACRIDELQLNLYELTCEKTGAHVIQLEDDTPENTFVISLQTLPTDSKGTPHILEHTVLCGSKKYPVPDPFFSMTRRSLSTFMNALTGSDFTCYPAASKVEKDYFNLMEVYLDAVFHPLLDKMSFLQEGHRLKLVNHGKASEALENHGVVYNEMKGSLSSNETRLWHAVMEHLYKDLPYRHNSGGEPSAIANLSYEELVSFHREFYTPSNAIFFFSGNIPLEKNLEFLKDKLLNETREKKPPTKMQYQKPFAKSERVTDYYPFDEQNLKDKAYAAFAFVTCPIENQEDLLALILLDSILMETDASPLKKALIESELCLRADSYIDQEMLQVPFAFICQDTDSDKIDALEKLLFDTLKQVKKEPFDSKLVDGAFLSLEMSRLEISRSFGPFALSLFWRSGLLKHHGIAPTNGLTTYSHLETLKKAIKKPTFFANLIDKYFLKNPSYVRLLFLPSNTLRASEEQAINQELGAKLSNMKEQDKEALIAQEKAFKSYQDSMADKSLDCLPSLELHDIPEEGEDYALDMELFPSFSLMRHNCFTNHIIYGELFMEVPTLSKEQLPYLKLLCDLLPHLGSAKRSSDENLLYINSHLGDFHCKLHLFEPWGMQEMPRVQWSLGGKVMPSDVRFFFQLLKDTLKKPHIHDISRIKVLLSQMVSGVTSSVAGRAMGYAKTLSRAGLTPAAGLREQWFGLSYANFLIEVKAQLEKDPSRVIDMLKSVWQRLSCSFENNFVITCDDVDFEKVKPHLTKFEAPIQAEKEPFIMPNMLSFPSLTGKIITSPVAFCASSFLLPHNLQQISPFIGLGSYIMENLYLHPTIREQGGAYGSGASYYAGGSTFTLNSYRDPHIAKTFDAFDDSFSIFVPGKIKASDVKQAVLGMIQDMDTPLSPGARGVTAYTYLMIKKDFALRQKQRHRLLHASSAQIVEAMQKVAHEKKSVCAKVAFSNQDKLSGELKALPAHISPVFNLEV